MDAQTPADSNLFMGHAGHNRNFYLETRKTYKKARFMNLETDFLSTYFTTEQVRPHVGTRRERDIARRKLTREDVAMVLELRSSGVLLKTTSYYVWNVGEDTLREWLKSWNVM